NPKAQHDNGERNSTRHDQQCLHLPERSSRQVTKKSSHQESDDKCRGGNNASESCKRHTKERAVEERTTGQVREHADEGGSRGERDDAAQLAYQLGRRLASVHSP